ncbi:helix-turn-helix domain-containing protein [Streptoalloteichus hindustanus]|uniref:Transcriptional regulatory protein, C terminal n=1 Tax=Streptoalloteichus hindustanus TaxID=2017 RepID=A0A1M5LWN7_STRHI|nr:helix-turn-helix domain-containing protein [Streptoalloteichus hindustanus]SHG69457.1 Transcriptional regulatory protein, C terminal [Streptoalloteichus hindustanus]
MVGSARHETARVDPGATGAAGWDREEVQLLRWPFDSARREHCRALGVLRLLVVEAGSAAPICSDVREDWVRAPVPREDLLARMAALRAKARAHRTPRLDPSGVLCLGERSISVSPAEAQLLELLVLRFAALVPREALRARLSDGDRTASRNALDLHIKRLRRRIAPLGLAIRTAWGRGYLLEFDAGVGAPEASDDAVPRPRRGPTRRGDEHGGRRHPGVEAGRPGRGRR